MTERLIQYRIILTVRQLDALAAFFLCDLPGGPTKIGYGGARGGGKSHILLVAMALACDLYPGIKCLLLRKLLKRGKEGFRDLRRRAIQNIPHTYNESSGIVSFPNGSEIYIGHYQHENNVDDYLGLEYAVIGIEESTTLTPNKLTMIGTCNRSSNGFRPRIFETTNPGGVSHKRFKDTYIKPYRLGKETETRFIPATIDDNPFINTEYKSILENLEGWRRKAWRHGDWDIDSGLFFGNFSESIHVIDPFAIPDDWEVWVAMDYGYTHNTVFGLFAMSNDADIYVVDNHYDRKMLPEWHAPKFDQLLAKHGIQRDRIRVAVAGTDIFAQKGDRRGETVAQQYESLGWRFEPANTDRINGAATIAKGFGDEEHGIDPKLFILRTPSNDVLVDTISYMEHDPKKPEDVLKVDLDPESGEGGDDHYDMLRYGVMAARENSWVHNTAALEFLAGRFKSKEK